MRKWLAYGVAMIAAAVTVFTPGRTIKEREHEPRERRVGPDVARTAVSPNEQDVMISSLWLDGRIIECRTPAIYGPAPLRAHLGAVLKLTIRSAQAVRQARSIAWVAHEKLVLTAANDVDVVTRFAAKTHSQKRVQAPPPRQAPLLGDFIRAA